MQEKIRILKVPFDKITIEEAKSKITAWAAKNDQHQLATPNPEFLLEAQKNDRYLKILNKTSLNIPDGIGILWAAKYLKITENSGNTMKVLKFFFSLATILFYPKYIKSVIPERVTGTDLMQELCQKAAANKLTVFLLGAADGVAETTKENLTQKYPDLKIIGTYSGSPLKEEENSIIEIINNKRPTFLFVAYGAPAQEFWLYRNLPKMKSVKVAMGVGGAFDFIAGARRRAPKWMQKLGLEWLYRLVQEPKRIRRIYNATIKFPLTVLKVNLGPKTKKLFSWT